jgi:hypothetical protein
VFFDSGFILLSGAFDFTTVNYLYFFYAGTNDVEVTINQPSTSGSFLPTSLSGCVLWLDGSDPTSVTDTGTLQWADKSVSLNHATQATAGFKPTYSSGNKGFTFDNTDDFLTTLSNLSLSSQAFTMFFVLNRTTNEDDVVLSSAASGTYYLMIRSTSVLFGSSTFTPTASFNGFKLTGVVGSASALKLYNNGTLDSSLSAIGAATMVFNQIGKYTNSNSQKLDDLLKAVVIYNRVLDDSERVQVEGYLNSTFTIY